MAAIVLLGGCASQPSLESDALSQDAETAEQVSARQYGYVRPAVDVIVVERGRDGAAFYSFGEGPSDAPRTARPDTGDLWGRVRSGMRLASLSHPRIDQELLRLRANPGYLADVNGRARPYLQLIVAEIERRGLPMELALLPEVESRYNPGALSHKAASGMWQFIPETGRRYGLAQDDWYDGRNDILASTRAALDYLEWLHDTFEDWSLALAGYNCGEGAVANAIRANQARGAPTDFWSLDLPRETEQYVPKLLAVARLVHQPARYGQVLPRLDARPQLEVVDLGRPVDLAQAAQLAGLDAATVRRLNAGLKRGETRPNGPHRLLLPAGTGRGLRQQLARLEARPEPVAGPYYRIRRGDTLTAIASRHGTTVAALKKANRLKGSTVQVGRTLMIPAGKTALAAADAGAKRG